MGRNKSDSTECDFSPRRLILKDINGKTWYHKVPWEYFAVELRFSKSGPDSSSSRIIVFRGKEAIKVLCQNIHSIRHEQGGARITDQRIITASAVLTNSKK